MSLSPREIGSRTGKSHRGLGEAAEDRAAANLGMEKTPGSGAGPSPHAKMDLRAKWRDRSFRSEMQVEVKMTQARSFRLTEEILRKAVEQAAVIDKTPVINVQLPALQGVTEHDWVCLPMSAFKELIDG